MLETVIKRDGTREPANPSKINKWMQWGSVELRNRVEFSTAVTAAVSRCGTEVKSQDLQMYIIDELVRQGDWAHSLLAGRLFAVYLHKHIHGNRIPSVGEKMAQSSAIGLGTYMNYSTDDLKAIEDMINHERDYDMAEFQIKYIRGKYALQNQITGEEYETPQFVYMRMAMELSEDEPAAQRLVHVKNFYDHFSLGRISAPTPNYNNLGTPHRGFASCCVYMADDNIPSLAAGDHIAYMMTANSAGVGGFLATRTNGDPVRKGAIIHQGKLPYHDLQGRVVKANRQGSRGGALTTYYSAYDPEVIALTVAQNARTPISKQIRTINFAMAGNAWLAKKATFKSLEDRKVFLFTKFSAPELFRLFYTGDTEAFAKEYVRLELDETFEKCYIDARQIVVTAQTQRFEVGTLFFFNADEANRHTPFKDPIHSSNLCLAGDTKVSILKGEKVVEQELQDVKVGSSVLSYNTKTQKSEYKKVTAFAMTSPKAKVLRVTDTVSGKQIVCTPEHQVWTENRGYVKAGELKATDTLRIL